MISSKIGKVLDPLARFVFVIVFIMNGSSALKNISNKTQSEYLRRIHLALDFIDENINQVIRLDDVAKASYFSSFHFHRIFHALVAKY